MKLKKIKTYKPVKLKHPSVKAKIKNKIKKLIRTIKRAKHHV